MVCQVCGSTIEGESRFCPRCGAQVANTVPPVGYMGYAGYSSYPPRVVTPRVQRHLQTLGTLWCAFGVYRVVHSLFGLFLFRALAWPHFSHRWLNELSGPPWMSLMPVVVTMTVVMAGLALTVGYGLLTRKPWGRTMAIILGILALFRIPFGTALGIYTLWVLTPVSSAIEYESLADRS